MHVLLLYRDLNRPGGVPTDLKALCAAMREQGHEITAVAASAAGGGPPPVGVTRSLNLDHPGQILRLRKQLTGHRFDIAWVISLLHPWNTVMRALMYRAAIPLCVAPNGHAVSPDVLNHRFGEKRGFPLNKQMKMLHLRCVDRPLLKDATVVRALSPWEATQVIDMGARRCIVVPEGFPEPVTADETTSTASRSKVFGYLGRLAITQKGLDLLVPAARIVAAELGSQAFRILVAGPSVMGSRDRLQREAERAGMTNIEFLGPLSRNEKPAFWRACDFFLHPSRYEGMSRAAREAVSQGLPLLASKESNMGDWVADEGFGYQVAPTVESVAEGMVLACGVQRDVDTSMRQRARKFSLRWSWAAVAHELSAGFADASAIATGKRGK